MFRCGKSKDVEEDKGGKGKDKEMNTGPSGLTLSTIRIKRRRRVTGSTIKGKG